MKRRLWALANRLASRNKRRRLVHRSLASAGVAHLLTRDTPPGGWPATFEVRLHPVWRRGGGSSAASFVGASRPGCTWRQEGANSGVAGARARVTRARNGATRRMVDMAPQLQAERVGRTERRIAARPMLPPPPYAEYRTRPCDLAFCRTVEPRFQLATRPAVGLAGGVPQVPGLSCNVPRAVRFMNGGFL